MGKLTDVQIRNWIKAGSAIARADGDGLTFTLSEKGTAAWVLRYRFGGKARELTIGRYPDITLSKARELGAEARVQIQQGRDVAREKQKANSASVAAWSFRELAQDYMNIRFPKLAANTVKQRRHHINDLIIPKLGSLAAREVEGADATALVRKIGERSKSVAELVLTAISEIFKHGLAIDAVKANPCAVISAAAICGEAKPTRQRLMLTEEELRTILPALPGIGAENAIAVKVQLATCVRLGELTKAEWAHVDFDRAEWFIPDQNSKTGRGFTIPLPPRVVGWFKELEIFACGSRYVLPARQARRRNNFGGEVHFEQRALNSMLHKLCDRLNEAGTPVRRFTPHDLRSTARSHLAALGVNLIVAERCLNHSLGGLIAVYDQHDYLEERRAALTRWVDFLTACETGKPQQTDNVIPMSRAAA